MTVGRSGGRAHCTFILLKKTRASALPCVSASLISLVSSRPMMSWQIFSSSPSIFALYAVIIGTWPPSPSRSFSLARIDEMMRKAARRAPTIFLYATLSRLRCSSVRLGCMFATSFMKFICEEGRCSGGGRGSARPVAHTQFRTGSQPQGIGRQTFCAQVGFASSPTRCSAPSHHLLIALRLLRELRTIDDAVNVGGHGGLTAAKSPKLDMRGRPPFLFFQVGTPIFVVTHPDTSPAWPASAPGRPGQLKLEGLAA